MPGTEWPAPATRGDPRSGNDAVGGSISPGTSRRQIVGVYSFKEIRSWSAVLAEGRLARTTRTPVGSPDGTSAARRLRAVSPV